ncbi:hypothetical protein [Actinoplanes palleronii]|nr:hypothetical protein [Actinoplanes palleronii]
MRYATPNRSAHRATSAPDLTLLVHPLVLFRTWLVRQAPRPPAGQHRQPARPRVHTRLLVRPRRHAWREPHATMHLLTRGLAALIVLGICVMLGFLIVSDEGRDPAAATDRTIASRAADPSPLTVAETFPAGAAGYQVEKAVAETDCTVAVTGALRSELSGYGCSQAVRATLAVPDSGYLVTAGVLNLADTQSANAVADRVRALVETGDGSFTAMTGAQIPSGTPVGWRARGHYLLYCVITGPAGEPVPSGEPLLGQITSNLLDDYLSDLVLARRASGS